MNRLNLLTILLIFVLFSISANAQDLETKGPLSLDLNLDSRAAYEALAERAGLNVVFLRDYAPKAAEPFRVENKTPAEALDMLAKQTATFWTPWDKKSILVAEDNQQNRKDYDRQFVKILPVANRPAAEVAAELRTQGFKQVMPAGNALLVRDTAEQIRVAARAANPNAAAPTFDLEGVFVAETNPNARTPQSRRGELKISATDPISLNDAGSREIYERLAKNAGLNILFGRNFRSTNAKLVVRNVGFFDALDLLALSTSTFWQPLNENTMFVAEDTPQNRRDFDGHTVETIYLAPETPVSLLNEILSSLRIVLSLRGIFQAESIRAIVTHDSPAGMALTESLVAELSGAPIRKRVATNIRTMFRESGNSLHTASSDRNRLQIKTKDPIAFTSNSSSREAFEKLAAVAGLQVLFGRNFPTRNVEFSIQNVDVIEALDFLALQSGSYWEPLDSRTIFVLDDTLQNRRDFSEHLVKTIYLPRETSVNSLNQIMNVLRTALSLRGIYQSATNLAILVHDTPQRMALVETLVDHLNPTPLPAKSVQIPTSHYAESGSLRIAAAVRSELKLGASGPISINLNQNSQAIYEALADLLGIKVNFSPDFRPVNSQQFRLEGVDALDAIDYFSLRTGNAWKVVDAQTILVFPDTDQNHQNLDPQIVKTFYVGYKPSVNTVNGIVNVLRTALSLRNVQPADGAITVQETPQKMMVVENIIDSLDRPPLAPDNPETVSLKVVLSGSRGNAEVPSQTHVLDAEVGADPATFRSGKEISVQGNGTTTTQQVGIQIDSQVRTAADGRYKVSITVTTRDVFNESPAATNSPPIVAFRNFIFAGTIILSDGGTAQISGTEHDVNEAWRADITLSVKK